MYAKDEPIELTIWNVPQLWYYRYVGTETKDSNDRLIRSTHETSCEWAKE